MRELPKRLQTLLRAYQVSFVKSSRPIETPEVRSTRDPAKKPSVSANFIACCELARGTLATNGSFDTTSTPFLSSECFASLRGGIEPMLTGLGSLKR